MIFSTIKSSFYFGHTIRLIRTRLPTGFPRASAARGAGKARVIGEQRKLARDWTKQIAPVHALQNAAPGTPRRKPTGVRAAQSQEAAASARSQHASQVASQRAARSQEEVDADRDRDAAQVAPGT